jgi:hypothetical protein
VGAVSKPFAGIPPEEQLEPRRLTPTERLHEVTLAALQRSPQPSEHTVDIARNAKGVYQWSVAVRGDDLDECVQRAVEKAQELAVKFPYEGDEPDDATQRAARAAAAIASNQARRKGA